MTRQTAKEAKARIARNLEHVEKTGEPVAFERDGKPVAVLVSAKDFALLQRLREAEADRLDIEEAERRLSDPSEVPIPFEEARKRFRSG